MIEITIPGYWCLQLEHLVMDYNGTLACDGYPVDGVKEILVKLSERIDLHVLTADTFGRVASELAGLPLTLSIVALENQDQAKLDYIRKLGTSTTVCIGNGRNDRRMLKEAILGIAVIQEEGGCVETLSAADVVCKDILAALHLLINTNRLVATLRS